jgi:hypothetical protein
MKGFRVSVLLALTSITLLIAFHSFGRVSAQVNPPADLQKWEYRLMHSASELEFNALGSQGWELCVAVGKYPDNIAPVNFVFKRRVR